MNCTDQNVEVLFADKIRYILEQIRSLGGVNFYKFNDLLKRYYDNVFFVEDSHKQDDEITKDNIDDKLKGFRGLFKGKSLGNVSKKGTDVKDEDFSNINIKDMGNYTE